MLSCRIAIVVFSCLLSACSIYPTVDEWTGKDTYQIVRDFRCEARSAIIDELVGIINDKYSDDVVYKKLKGFEFVEALQHREILTNNVDFNLLDRKLRNDWEYYLNATISYDFTLQVEERNDQDVVFNVTSNAFGSASKLPFGVNNDHTRNVNRNFFVFDTWSNLFKSEKINEYCHHTPSEDYQQLPSSPNFQYPVAGRLKLKELIRQFVNVNQSGNLSNSDVSKFKVAGGSDGSRSKGKMKEGKSTKDTSPDPSIAPTMSDTITFTTKIAANADPAAIIGTTLKHYTFTDFALKLDNSRQDMDKIIVVVSLPTADGGFTSVASPETALLGLSSQRAATKLLSARETARQLDYSTRNALIQLGTGASNLFH